MIPTAQSTYFKSYIYAVAPSMSRQLARAISKVLSPPRKGFVHQVLRTMSSSRKRDAEGQVREQQDNNYGDWSSERLIARVLELEGKLRNQVHNMQVSPAVEPSPPQSKKKTKVFDFSQYETRKIALKFAYLGASYNGFEHHANNKTPLPTVEEELWKALVRTRMIPHGKGTDIIAEQKSIGAPLPHELVLDWDGCDYSKCGRTDRGVSAFGQVISLRVRTSQKKRNVVEEGSESVQQTADAGFDPVKDELPYITMLNRALPPSIRILAWSPSVPSNFDARFSCREREYRYFFTSPAFLPLPGSLDLTKAGTPYLDIPLMQEAAGYLVGTHDFRNLSKIDASKQLTVFDRRVSHASIDFVSWLESPTYPAVANASLAESESAGRIGLYTFTVKGSAFLWHQVRCMVGVLFLVGQRLEKPTVVKELLDVASCIGKPKYEMANDRPLVLWNCKFSKTDGKIDPGTKLTKPLWDRGDGDDEVDWIHSKSGPGSFGFKSSQWGKNGVMDDLWRSWRGLKMEEILASQLMDVVAFCDMVPADGVEEHREQSIRVFQGDNVSAPRGKHIPIMERERQEPVEIVNARWLEKYGSGRADKLGVGD